MTPHDENCLCDGCVTAGQYDDPWGCPVCSKQFVSVIAAGDHWDKEHRQDLDEKFDNGEDVLDHFDVDQASRPNV